MKLMQLIKLVLEDAYGAIEAKDDAEKDKLIKAEIATLSSAYAKLTDWKAQPIDYSQPIKRFAYIFKYTVAHADYIMQIIKGETQLCQLLMTPTPE